MDILSRLNNQAKPLDIKYFKQEPLNLPDLPTIEKKESNTPRLYVTPDGNKYPSVTSILGLLENPAVLNAWRKRIGREEADRQTREAIERGNKLHSLCEAYLENRFDESELGYDHGSMMFRHVKPLLDEIQSVLAIEAPLYSDRYKFAGRTDIILKHEGDICIGDHKNSKKLLKNAKLAYLKEKLYKYQLQTYMYREALREMTGLEATHGILFVSRPKLSPEESYESEMIKWRFDEGNYKQMMEMILEEYYR